MKDLAVESSVLGNIKLNEPVSDFELSLTVQQASELTGLSEHNLRYYERVGLISPVSRESNSRHRRYSAMDISRIQSLACLRMVGMSLEDMRHYFEKAENGKAAAPELREILAQQRPILQKRIVQMNKSLEYLENKIKYWQAIEAGDKAESERILRLIQQTVKD